MQVQMTSEELANLLLDCYIQGWDDAAKTLADVTPNKDALLRQFTKIVERRKATSHEPQD